MRFTLQRRRAVEREIQDAKDLLYRELDGYFIYIECASRLEIKYGVSYPALYFAFYRQEYRLYAKRVATGRA